MLSRDLEEKFQIKVSVNKGIFTNMSYYIGTKCDVAGIIDGDKNEKERIAFQALGRNLCSVPKASWVQLFKAGENADQAFIMFD